MATTLSYNFEAEPEDDDSSEGHPESEIIGMFFTGELEKGEQREVEKHLAGCDRCRQELATHLRFAEAELTPEEMRLLDTAPSVSPEEYLRDIKRLLDDTPGPAQPPARTLWNWLDDLLISPALAPAIAVFMVAIVSLAGWQINKTYQQNRLANELASGYEALHTEWFLTGEDLRPEGFARSPFSRAHGETTVADSNAAVRAFRHALRRDPQIREALLGLATFYYFSGQLFLADSLTRNLLARDSTDAAAWNHLGLVQARAGDSSAALSAFDAALRYRPNFAEAAFNRAQLLTELQRKPEALLAWENYLRIDPSSSWAEAARARVQALETSP